jgi:hypothetical protein
MQNHASGVDERPQRIIQSEAELLLHGAGHAGQRKLQPSLVEQIRCDFLSQAGKHHARRMDYRIMAGTFYQELDGRVAHHLIDRWKLAKKFRGRALFHAKIIP